MKKIIAFFVLLIILAAPLGVLANGSTTISIDTLNVSNAEDVAFVDINISGNSGISAMTISITYDASAMQYTDFKKGIFTDYSVKDYSDNGYIRLVVLEDADINEDGLLISLGFKLKNAEQGRLYPIGIEYSSGDFCNARGEEISPKIVSGGVAFAKTGSAEQTPSKYESSSLSSQNSETTVQSSSISSGNSSKIDKTSDFVSSNNSSLNEIESNSSTVSITESLATNNTDNNSKFIVIYIAIAVILVALTLFIIFKNKK